MKLSTILLVTGLVIGVMGCATTPKNGSADVSKELSNLWMEMKVSDIPEPAVTPHDAIPALKDLFKDGFKKGVAESIKQFGSAELPAAIYETIGAKPADEQSAFMDGWYEGVAEVSKKKYELHDQAVVNVLKRKPAKPVAAVKPVPKKPAPKKAEPAPKKVKPAKPAKKRPVKKAKPVKKPAKAPKIILVDPEPAGSTDPDAPMAY